MCDKKNIGILNKLAKIKEKVRHIIFIGWKVKFEI